VTKRTRNNRNGGNRFCDYYDRKRRSKEEERSRMNKRRERERERHGKGKGRNRQYVIVINIQFGLFCFFSLKRMKKNFIQIIFQSQQKKMALNELQCKMYKRHIQVHTQTYFVDRSNQNSRIAVGQCKKKKEEKKNEGKMCHLHTNTITHNFTNNILCKMTQRQLEGGWVTKEEKRGEDGNIFK
jgi:hypothetical protein